MFRNARLTRSMLVGDAVPTRQPHIRYHLVAFLRLHSDAQTHSCLAQEYSQSYNGGRNCQ
ncbi:hypothetical protein BC835DRAFT_1399384 [Cytidiella melzeri]|nr:hypothetical protein BC835DRAFT_1399384 [Cytidiella melzeri]